MWKTDANLVEEFRKKNIDKLVRGSIGFQSEDLENKAWRLERGEKRQLLSFLVLESNEKSAVG
jgi:hypothetical protein